MSPCWSSSSLDISTIEFLLDFNFVSCPLSLLTYIHLMSSCALSVYLQVCSNVHLRYINWDRFRYVAIIMWNSRSTCHMWSLILYNLLGTSNTYNAEYIACRKHIMHLPYFVADVRTILFRLGVSSAVVRASAFLSCCRDMLVRLWKDVDAVVDALDAFDYESRMA
jgi:hypothetical protein